MKKIIKIILVLVVAIVVGSILVGTSKKDDTKNTNSQKPNTSQEDKQEKLAMKRCVVMEAKDIYSTPVAPDDEDFVRENAISSARSYCLDFESTHGTDALIEDMEVDWKSRQGEELLGHPLTYWFENYNNLEKLYSEALRQ